MILLQDGKHIKGKEKKNNVNLFVHYFAFFLCAASAQEQKNEPSTARKRGICF